MARQNLWQNIGRLFAGNNISPEYQKSTNSSINPSDEIIYKTDNKEDYINTLDSMRQQKLLYHQWVKAGAINAMESMAGYTATRLMYRDADLMAASPEIGSALNVMAQEACANDSHGQMLHVYSSSKRIKSILEDLFYNRLSINVNLLPITRNVLKYGNEFMLLDLRNDEGVANWMRLPVNEMDRLENGFSIYNGIGDTAMNINDLKPNETKFAWVGHNENMPFRNYQVAHFRCLFDNFFLPYGTSVLHPVRRAWRMWNMMEDAMLIYRLDRSVERRVFKVYVGNIDDADIPAYISDVANRFKRTPIIDPQTGQVDLRKGFMDVSQDYFIPVRTENAANPIESVSAAQNPTSMDDIEYMKNKILSGLMVPKSFINFQEAQGKGQNLSLLDIRFCRMINKVQQFLLLELNKIAMIHLYILGFRDDVSNFTLSLTNPSAQIEALELEDLSKRIQTATAALQDSGIGLPLLSYHRVLRDIMKLTDDEIKDMLNEIRLEKAMVNELQETPNIIKKTHVFDTVDRIYGDPKVINNSNASFNGGEEQEQGGMGGGSDGFDGGSLNMDTLGGPGEENFGETSGSEASGEMSEAPQMDSGPMESKKDKKPLINERVGRRKFTSINEDLLEQYFSLISNKTSEEKIPDVDYVGKNVKIFEDIDNIGKEIDDIVNESTSIREDLDREIKTLNKKTRGRKK